MKLRRRDAMLMSESFNICRLATDDVFCRHFVISNLKKLGFMTELIKISCKIPDDLKEYENKIDSIYEKYSDKKDEKGKPLTQNGRYLISNSKKEFVKEITNLKNENEELNIRFDRHRDQVERFLEEEIEIDFETMNVENFPDNVDSRYMKILFRLLK